MRILRSLAITASFAALLAGAQDNIRYVNPLVGTAKSKIGYGGTMPFVTAPFGMTDWTPQTRQNKISRVSYEYSDTTITGFMGTHQPAIWMGDFGYVTLMPQVGELRTSPDARSLPFSHKDEEAHPDYYAVTMDAGNGKQIRAEMTATERCALLLFHFPQGEKGRVLVEAARPRIAGEAAFNAQTGEITG